MPRLPPTDLEPGMKLAKPVTNESGMVLLKEGTELTDSLIDKLRNMGVDAVYIKGTSRPALPMEEMLSLLDKRFIRAEGDSNMAIIKKVVREHIEGLYG